MKWQVPTRVAKFVWLCWRSRRWPWNVPWDVVYLDFSPVTEKEVKRTQELNSRFGWEKKDG